MNLNYSDEIITAASAHGLDPLLVAAIVQVESSSVPWAWKPEPKYQYFWNVKLMKPFRPLVGIEASAETAPKDFPCLAGDNDQEWWAQQASWGLMQIMGANAREHGFRGPYLTELCEPSVNLSIGCEVLTRLLVWAKGNVTAALAAYNGGKSGNALPPYRNADYASNVLAARAVLKGLPS